MKLYIQVKPMTFEEENNEIEHQIITRISDFEYLGYDNVLELTEKNQFIQNTMKVVYKKDNQGKDIDEIDYKMFVINEQETWHSFPLYELKNGKIIDFNYKNYSYFLNTDRRTMLSKRINKLYNYSSELKILRKTVNKILKQLNIKDDSFETMNRKIESTIEKIPKKKNNSQ
jgi:hypothetical protein